MIAQFARFERALFGVGNVKMDVPERCERTKDVLHNTVSDNVPFLWSLLVDSKSVIQEAEYVLQKKELRPIELHIRQHVAHQGVPAIRTASTQGQSVYPEAYLGSSCCYWCEM